MRTLHMLHALEANVGELTSTVRLGFKWADSLENELLVLCVCTRDPETHVETGLGRVKDKWVGSFRDIPARHIANEHEISSRNYNGLRDSMKKAYGDKFEEDSTVVVLIYERLR